MWPCPVCDRQLSPGLLRCPSCGADLMDPEVRALAGAPPAAQAPPIGAGSLSVGRFLGVTAEGLESGRSARLAAIVLGALLVVAFFIPAAQVGHWESVYDKTAREWVPKVRWEHLMSWELFADGPGLALLLPLVLGVLAIGVGVTPRVPPHLRSGALTLFGLAGWLFGMGPLGGYGKAPTTVIHLLFLGVAVTGAALFLRLLYPASRPARIALLGGAGIVVLGYAIPIGDLARVFPIEFAQYQELLRIDLTMSPPLFAIVSGISPRAAPILFVAGFAILPFLLAPTCAGLGWIRPREAWDKVGIYLRPMGWIVVLFVPLWYALMAFNLLGWGTVSTEEAALPRARLALLAAAYFLWIQIGAAGVAQRYRR